MRTVITSARDTSALLLIACYRYLTRIQLQDFLLGATDWTLLSREVITRRILQRLISLNLVAATPRLVGGPGGGSTGVAYYLTASGDQLAASLEPGQPSRKPTSKGTFLMHHAIATADVALAFRRAAARRGDEILEWECDWKAALRVGSALVVPDARLVYATAEHELEALIEIDIGTEGTRFFARKIARYVELFRGGTWRERFPIWPLVLTITPSQQRATALKRATEVLIERQSDATRLIKQTEFGFAALPRVITESPLAAIWSAAGKGADQPLLGHHLE